MHAHHTSAGSTGSSLDIISTSASSQGSHGNSSTGHHLHGAGGMDHHHPGHHQHHHIKTQSSSPSLMDPHLAASKALSGHLGSSTGHIITKLEPLDASPRSEGCSSTQPGHTAGHNILPIPSDPVPGGQGGSESSGAPGMGGGSTFSVENIMTSMSNSHAQSSDPYTSALLAAR